MRKKEILILFAMILMLAGCTCFDEREFLSRGSIFFAGEEARAGAEKEKKEAPEAAGEEPAVQEAAPAGEEAIAEAEKGKKEAPEAAGEEPAVQEAAPAGEEAIAGVGEGKKEALEDIKERFLRGDIPQGFAKEEIRELFHEPCAKYVSDSEFLEIWFYEDFYVGFDKEGKAIKTFSEKHKI